MSSFPRRSARLSPHLAQDQTHGRNFSSNSVPSFSQFSQPSSASTTSHPSPSNDGLNPPPPPPTPHQAQQRLQVQSPFLSQQSHLHAPLPSPSAGDMDSFFGRPHSQPSPFMSQQMSSTYMPQESQQQGFGSHQQSQQQQQQQQQHSQQQFHPHTNSFSHSHPQNVQAMNPGQLPPDFLAEAAKRAQMACLMRDLGDVSL